MSKRRRYSDDERAACLAALVANGGDVRKTARQVGVPETTLRQWKHRDRAPVSAEKSAQKKAELADIFEAIARDALAAVTPEKIALANVQQLLVSAGVATDKMRLLRNQPTENVASLVIVEEIISADDHPPSQAPPGPGGIPAQ